MDLRTYLFKNRITQTDFAKLIGVSRWAINHYLRGKIPCLSVAKKIEKVTEGKVTVKDQRKGKPSINYICPTCHQRRRVKKAPKQMELFE